MPKTAKRPARKRRSGFAPLTELRYLGVCALLGFIVLPCLIWVVGRIALGPYTHGSLFALWGDFLRGLAQGSPAFWIVAAGPFVFLCLLRIGWRLLSR